MRPFGLGEDPLAPDRQVCFSVKDTGASLRLDPATLSPLLKRREGLGYLTRARNAADERMLDVTLTEHGRDLRAEAEKIPYAAVERLGVTVKQLTDLHRLLSTVIAATQP